jgi:hypothetical protein
MQARLITQEDYQGLLGQLDSIEKKLDRIIPEKLGEVTYNSEQVCKMLGIATKTLQNYRDKKRIGFSQVGTKIWYTAKDVQEFLNRNRLKPRELTHVSL